MTNDLALGAGGVLGGFDAFEFVVGAVDFHFQAGLLNEVLLGENRQVGIVIDSKKVDDSLTSASWNGRAAYMLYRYEAGNGSKLLMRSPYTIG